MEEERKKQLEREVFDLSQTAASLSSNIHDKRNELASLEAGKNAFLEKRLADEAFLLKEIREKIESGKTTLDSFLAFKEKSLKEIADERQSVQKERQIVLVFEKNVLERENVVKDTEEETRKTLENTKNELRRIEEIAEETKQIKRDVINELNFQEQKLDKIKHYEEKVKFTETRNRKRTEELSDLELSLKNREKIAEAKLDEAKRLNDEAKRLVEWHTASKTL